MRSASGTLAARWLVASISLQARLVRRDVQLEFFGAPNHHKPRSNPDLRAGQQFVQRIDAGDRMSAEFNDHVAFTQTGKLRRTVRFDGKHQHAVLNGQMVVANHTAVQFHVLSGQTDVPGLTKGLQTITDKIANDPSVKKQTVT